MNTHPFTLPQRERILGSYDFENGEYVKIIAFGIDTEKALEMVDEIVKLKRAEIEAIKRGDT